MDFVGNRESSSEGGDKLILAAGQEEGIGGFRMTAIYSKNANSSCSLAPRYMVNELWFFEGFEIRLFNNSQGRKCEEAVYGPLLNHHSGRFPAICARKEEKEESFTVTILKVVC